jgi:hypothetical protein
MSLRRALPLLIAALLLVGCMNVSSTLTVRPDGSGTITERLTLNPEVARMVQSLDQTFDSTGTPQDLFSEDELRAEADSVPGLSLQSFTRIDDATGVGYEAVYAFDDLNDAQFDPAPDDVLPDGAMDPTDDGAFDLMSELSFTFTPGTPATLTVRMPQDTAEGIPDPATADTASVADDRPSEQELEMMRALMQDAGLRVAVQIDGQIVETNATHRSGSTVTLLELDFGALAQDSTAFRELMTLSDDPTDPAAPIDRLNALPGMTVEPRETVTIRFR